VIGGPVVVRAVLETAIDTRAPGVVVARVQAPVYDHALERVALPELTQLVGRVVGATELGQERVRVVFTRAVLPSSGRQVALDPPWPGVDLAGATGLSGRVDRHAGEIVAGSALSALIRAGGRGVAGTQSPRDVRPGQQALLGAADGAGDVGDRIAQQYAQLPPTVRLDAGAPVGALIVVPVAIPMDAPAAYTTTPARPATLQGAPGQPVYPGPPVRRSTPVRSGASVVWRGD